MRRDLGPMLAAAAMVAGARVGEVVPWAGSPLPAFLLAVAVPVAIVRVVPRLRRLAGFVCLAALGTVSMGRAVSGLGGEPAGLAVGEVEGRVVVRLAADPQGQWTLVRAPTRLEAVDGRAAHGAVLVAAAGPAAGRVRVLEAGESATLVGRFRPLDAGEGQWRWRHVAAVFEAHDLVGAGPAAPAVMRAANGVRHRVLAGGEMLGATDRALVAGFLVGDDRDLPQPVAADFRAAGLSHLLVVSGANVTLALALVAPLLQRCRLLGRLVGGLAVLLIFCAMTRFEPSVLRAGAMSGLALLAAFLGRPVTGLRLLSISVTGLVLVDPFLVHSLGFGLSCGASAGILGLAGPLRRRMPGPRFVREPLAVTAAAQIGVAPVALPAFGHLPLGALPANLAAAPAAAALSLWGLASGLAGGLLGGDNAGPAAMLQVPTAVLAGWIRVVAHLAARCPVMIGPRAVALIGLVVVVWCVRSGADRHPIGVVDSGFPGGVRLQAQPVVDGQQPGTGEQQGGGGDGVEQVELEAAPARLAEHPHRPLHLGHDQQELHGGQRTPEPGQQAESQTDPAHELDHDRGPGQELREREAVAGHRGDELPDAAGERLPPVVGQHRPHHDPDGEQRRSGREGPAQER